jgi:phage baseplate assembly protein V
MEYQDVEDLHQNVSHRVTLGKTDDSGDQQLIDYKGLEGEEHTEVLRVMPHGLASHAPANSEGIILGLGTRDMPIALGMESPKHRPKNLPEGATKLYDTDGSFVYLDAAGNLFAEVKKGATVKAGEAATVEAPTITLKGNVKIEGTLDVTGAVTTGSSITSAGAHVASAHV